jgi:hypothetical protein
MPKYARGSDIDLEEAYGELLAGKKGDKECVCGIY